MKDYTVILLYPDYIACDFPETFMAHIEGVFCAKQAVRRAQIEAFAANDTYDPINLDDFKALYVFDGILDCAA